MSKLSTGYKQRLNLARGFVNDPAVLFLDEPTLGLDVLSARHLRTLVKDWIRTGGKTVLLTTHYMAEADQMCDRVGIINRGKILACDTPQQLKMKISGGVSWKIEITPNLSQPESIKSIAEIGLPILTIGAYVILYRALKFPSTAGAAVIIGGAMIAFWTNVLWNMSSQWFWEREVGNLEMYLVAPVSRMSILLGMAMGGGVNTALRALGIVLLGIFIFQVPFQLKEPLLVGVVFVLTLVALYALGMLFASLFMLYGREAWNTANLLQEPVYFLSGAYFPGFYG